MVHQKKIHCNSCWNLNYIIGGRVKQLFSLFHVVCMLSRCIHFFSQGTPASFHSQECRFSFLCLIIALGFGSVCTVVCCLSFAAYFSENVPSRSTWRFSVKGCVTESGRKWVWSSYFGFLQFITLNAKKIVGFDICLKRKVQKVHCSSAWLDYSIHIHLW